MSKSVFAERFADGVVVPNGLIDRLRAAFRSTMILCSSIVQLNGRHSLRCLYCHYVFDDQVGEFDALMRMLSSHGTFINTDRCLRIVNGEEPVDGRLLHLSFDDGFKNNITNAFPILQKYRIPAIFFVPTAFVGGAELEARRYCTEVAGYRAPIEMLTWEDCRELVASGHEIGSHTRNHVKLSRVSASERILFDELSGSKSEIEDQIGRSCDYIAWPFGKRSDFDATALEAVKRAGYRGCFGAFRAAIKPSVTNSHSIPRHHFEPQWPKREVLFFAKGGFECTR